MTINVRMMTDWTDGEQALQNAPPEVRDFELDHQDKGTQDVFVGRHGEEARLLRLLRRNVSSRPGDTQPPQQPAGMSSGQHGGKGIIITAPPGAGKSTLLDHVLQKAKQDGIGVVHVSPDSLADAHRLNEKIQSQDPWKSWIGEPRLRAKLTDALAAGADSIIRVLLQTVGDMGGVQINSSNVEVFTRLIEGWRQRETYPTLELLQQIDSVYPGGFVFAIDEAQQLRRHLDHDSNCTSAVLNTLGDPNTRRDTGIAHGTIILAGLSDTEHVVREFGTLRQQVIQLQPIRPEAVAELIEVRIRNSGCTPEECDAAVQAWRPPLAAEFGTWTHHAQCAAYAAQQVLANFGRAALDSDWGWPLVWRETFRGVEELYLFVTTRAQDSVGTIHMETVAHALWHNGNYIAHDTMKDLIAHTEKRRTANGLHPGKDVDDIIMELLHAGLIEPVSDPRRVHRVPTARGHPSGFRIGIPSVGNYITQTPPDKAMLERIATCGLRTGLGPEFTPAAD